VDFDAPPAEDYFVLADRIGTTVDSMKMGILVFGTKSALTCLEFYELEDRRIRSLPSLGSLEPSELPR
jgi:hypothetical protein